MVMLMTRKWEEEEKENRINFIFFTFSSIFTPTHKVGKCARETKCLLRWKLSTTLIFRFCYGWRILMMTKYHEILIKDVSYDDGKATLSVPWKNFCATFNKWKIYQKIFHCLLEWHMTREENFYLIIWPKFWHEKCNM